MANNLTNQIVEEARDRIGKKLVDYTCDKYLSDSSKIELVLEDLETEIRNAVEKNIIQIKHQVVGFFPSEKLLYQIDLTPDQVLETIYQYLDLVIAQTKANIKMTQLSNQTIQDMQEFEKLWDDNINEPGFDLVWSWIQSKLNQAEERGRREERERIYDLILNINNPCGLFFRRLDRF